MARSPVLATWSEIIRRPGLRTMLLSVVPYLVACITAAFHVVVLGVMVGMGVVMGMGVVTMTMTMAVVVSVAVAVGILTVTVCVAVSVICQECCGDTVVAVIAVEMERVSERGGNRLA